MNRLSWDTTAARRPAAKRAPQPRPDKLGLVARAPTWSGSR